MAQASQMNIDSEDPDAVHTIRVSDTNGVKNYTTGLEYAAPRTVHISPKTSSDPDHGDRPEDPSEANQGSNPEQAVLDRLPNVPPSTTNSSAGVEKGEDNDTATDKNSNTDATSRSSVDSNASDSGRPSLKGKWKARTSQIIVTKTLQKSAQDTYGDKGVPKAPEEVKLPWYLVDLEGQFRIFWDLLQVIVLAYVALCVPLRVAFAVRTWGVTFWVEVLVDGYFYIDIVINFLSVVRVEDAAAGVTFVSDLRGIAAVYLKGWFVLDILACLPLDYATRAEEGTLGCSFYVEGCGDTDPEDEHTHLLGLEAPAPLANTTAGNLTSNALLYLGNSTFHEQSGSSAGQSQALKLLKLLRVFRLLKLVRLTRVKRILDRYQDKMVYYAHLLICMKVFGVLTLTSHWLGCLYGSVYDWEDGENLTDKWVSCFYWAVQTITTVGYGDLTQNTHRGMMLASVGMLVGGVVFSWFMSSVFSLINPDPTKEKQQETMQYVVNYLKTNHLPPVTAARVLSYFRKTSHTYHFDEEQMLASLPFHLRQEIFDQLYTHIIRSCPLFDQQESHFINQLSLNMHPITQASNEFVYQKGTTGEMMYILVSGEVYILENVNKRHIVNDVLFDTSMLDNSLNVATKYNTKVLSPGGGPFSPRPSFELMARHPEADPRAKRSYLGWGGHRELFPGETSGRDSSSNGGVRARFHKPGSMFGEGPVLGYKTRTEHVLCRANENRLVCVRANVMMELLDIYPEVRQKMLVAFLQRVRSWMEPAEQREVLAGMDLHHLMDEDPRKGIRSDFRLLLGQGTFLSASSSSFRSKSIRRTRSGAWHLSASATPTAMTPRIQSPPTAQSTLESMPEQAPGEATVSLESKLDAIHSSFSSWTEIHQPHPPVDGRRSLDVQGVSASRDLGGPGEDAVGALSERGAAPRRSSHRASSNGAPRTGVAVDEKFMSMMQTFMATVTSELREMKMEVSGLKRSMSSLHATTAEQRAEALSQQEELIEEISERLDKLVQHRHSSVPFGAKG